jgi:cytochrome c oxidase cbb3-type subunit 3
LRIAGTGVRVRKGAWMAAGLSVMAMVCACTAEKRAVGPNPPQTRPIGKLDPRRDTFEKNVFQVSEGGRMFQWQGCDSCHTETAPGAARLTDRLWRYGGTTEEIYASIADGRPDGMPAYGPRIASDQIWQIAAFLHNLPDSPPAQRARQTAALQGEPQGTTWKGPIQ